MCGTSVSRHERGHRVPVLEAVLGYGIIFGANISELYEGMLGDVHEAMQPRARGLLRSLERQAKSGVRDRKIAVVKKLLSQKGKAL